MLAHAANTHITYRALLFLIPVTTELVINRTNNRDQFRSIEFLDWCVQNRTARARLELDENGMSNDLRGASEITKDGPLDLKSAYLKMFTFRE